MRELCGEAESEQLLPDQLAELLALLLPGASAQQLEYAAAMLLPAGATASSGLTAGELAAAAAECAALERRLQQQPLPEALRGVRQLAAALGSRSLDVAAAFAGAEGGSLPYAEVVRPPATAAFMAGVV